MRGRVIRLALPLVLVAAIGAGAAMAAVASTRSSGATVKVMKSSKYGTVLVSARGRALYRYTPDRKRVSNCTGACAAYWPPLVVKRGVKPTAGPGVNARLLGTLKRSNGSVQVTYAGFPLYLYAADSKSGDVKGEGFQGKWYLVNTKGALVKHAATTSGGGYGGGGGGGGGWG